jgi:DNA-binding CsgD family transcriptional regulator
MRTGSEPYRQLIWNALRKDAVRGGLCVVLMVVLALGSLSLWLALVIPWLVYAGLWLVSASLSQRPDSTQPPALPESGNEDHAKCLELQQQIHGGFKQIEDPPTVEGFRRNICWIDKSLEAIAEDGKYEFSEPLLALTGLTNELLADYLKVARRGFDDAEIRERVRGNLETLDIQYERVWKLLNRDTVENLKELSTSIDKTKRELGEQPNPPGLPAELPKSAKESVPPKAAEKDLTPRELEVVRLIARGLSDPKIGEELFIGTRTASSHVSNILKKLGVSTRAEIAAWAVRNGLV